MPTVIKKTPAKNGRTAKVTFELPAAAGAGSVALCGDFNGWSETSHPMTKRKDGRFSITVTLDSGRSHRFRYLIDGERWENDWEADSYVRNDFGGDDSVVDV
jgi:1,4-alpha-glucan branching enzyme